MPTITVSVRHLVVSALVVTTLAALGHGAWRDLRREARLVACQSVGEGLRRASLAQLAERDEADELPPNPAELPEDAATLDPSLPGWRGYARTWRAEVYGQFSVSPTETGFRVDVECVALPGEAPVHLLGTEAYAVSRDAPRVGDAALAQAMAVADNPE